MDIGGIGAVVVAVVVGFFVLFLVGVALLARHAFGLERRRVAELTALCAQHGWRYSGHDAYGVVARWQGGPPFDDGFSRQVRHVVSGEYAARPLLAFDYSYETPSMDDGSSFTHHVGVVALGLPGPLPDLELAPENVLARIARRLGMRDVRVGHPDFDRAFVVRCSDERVVPLVLTPRAIEALLHHGPVCLRVAGSDLLSWGDWLRPEDLLRRAHLLAEIAHGVPADAGRSLR